MNFHCISSKFRTKLRELETVLSIHAVICLLNINQSCYYFLASSFIPQLSQVLIKITKIKTLIQKHLFFKLLLNIYLIFKIVLVHSL